MPREVIRFNLSIHGVYMYQDFDLFLYLSDYYHSSYRKMPTFGRDTIRKFNNNASGMKKLAARDFEDLLQVRVPYVLNSTSK